jgi:hypothetical protein
MIYNFQSQNLMANPVELAQQKLKTHSEKGILSPLSIFEVANLMDTVLFTDSNSSSANSPVFQICFN